MTEKPNSFLGQRWVILLAKDDYDNFDEDEFRVVTKAHGGYGDEPDAYGFVLIESLTQDSNYRPDDILCITNALAVHEEWSNAIVIREEEVEDIYNDLYPWPGSGGVLMGDMLTDMEKLNFLVQYFYIETKTLVEIKDIMVKKDKDGVFEPIEDKEELLFGDRLYSAKFQNKETTLWWQSILEESGLYVVVLDESLDDKNDDEDEDTETAKYLDYPWGSYDDYDYGDDYYKRL